MRRTRFSGRFSTPSVAPIQEHGTSLAVGRSRRPSILSTSSLAASNTQSVDAAGLEDNRKKPKGPLELYEYGDPMTEFVKSHSYIPQLRDDTPHLRYLSQPELTAVRGVETLAGRTLLDVAKSLVPINGAHVLMLASGHGATVPKVAKLGPSSLTLVDLDPLVVRRAVERVEAVGQSASVSLVPHVADAWDFVKSTDEKYDLVICVHSIGQIIKSSPDGIDEFVADVTTVLAPGGVLILDEHMGFTDTSAPQPGSVDDRVDRYVATGLGKFTDDVNYVLPRAIPGCVIRSKWVTPGRPHHMQRWQYIAWEKRAGIEIVQPPQPVTFRNLGCVPVCAPVEDTTLFHLGYPALARGVKVPLARDDRSTVQPGRMMPKIDGTSAVVILKDNMALHCGPRLAGSFPLTCDVEGTFICTAELVLSSAGDYLLFLTGVSDSNGRACDPQSNLNLRQLDTFSERLADTGIIVNSPNLMSHVTGNLLHLPKSPAGRTVPVDGVNVMTGGRWGRFFKPSSTLSIDTTETDWPLLTDQLGGTVGLFRPLGSAVPPKFPAISRPASVDNSPIANKVMNDVHELGLAVDGITGRLSYLRRRPDKQGSDTLGKIIVFLCASEKAIPITREIQTVSRVVNYLNTG